MAAQSRKLLPVLAAVGRAEQGGVFDAGVDRVRIGQRRLEVPDALELPRVRRAVVPLVRAGDAVVDELVADRLPGLAAVVGALDQLPEPAAGLRGIQPIRVGGRSLEVVDLPAAKMRTADVPPLRACRPTSGRTRPCACQPVPVLRSSVTPSGVFATSFAAVFTAIRRRGRATSQHVRSVLLYCRSGHVWIDTVSKKIARTLYSVS